MRLEVAFGLIHSTIGPTIANKKMTLAIINHNDAYVYKPCPILSICKKFEKWLSATTGLKATWTLEVDAVVESIPRRAELMRLKIPNPSSKNAGKWLRKELPHNPDCSNRLSGKIDNSSKKNNAPMIAPNGKFCVYS